MPALLALLLAACTPARVADVGPSMAVVGDDDTSFVATGLLDDTGTVGSTPTEEAPVPVAVPVPVPAEAPVERVTEVAAVEVDPPAPRAAPPVDYTLDPADSFLAVTVFNDPDTVGGGLGHDHVFSPSTFRGSVTWTPDDPGACDIRIRFPVGRLVVDPDGARGRVGLDPTDTVGPHKEAQILDNALGPKQLDADRFGSISYRGGDCRLRDDGRYDVTGVLSIHGVDHELTVPMAISDRDGFHATGRFSARATDFGFGPFKALAGALRNQDRMRFVVDVRGTR